MREWRTRAVAKPTIRFQKRAGTRGWHQGCRPFAAFATPHFSGLAPNVTFGSGVGTGRPGFGVGNRVQAIPITGVTRLWGRWTCPVHRLASGGAPVAIAAKGALSGAWVMNKHRSVRAYGERQRWSGVGFAPAPALAPSSHGNPGLGTKAGPRVAPRGSEACRKRRSALFPARGLRRFSEKKRSSWGFADQSAKSSS